MKSRTVSPFAMLVALAALTAIAATLAPAVEASDSPEYGVFEYVVERAEGSVDDIASAIAASAADAGWKTLANVEAGAPGECPYRARVVILFDEAYGAEVMRANPATGPFALVDRVAVFEDEAGTHVSIVNPHSITRTVLMEDTAFEPTCEEHVRALRGVVTSAVRGTASERQYGQLRSEGRIGKTMGVVAGGKFADLVEVDAEVEGGDVADVAGRVRAGLERPGKKWGLHAVFELDLPQYDLVVLGATGTPMDAKSFDIVKAGGDDSRRDFACPGLAYAGAYPIEVVVSRDGDRVRVRSIEAMFRMKMYFEDAGKWAFMNHMKMPGSIAKEMRKQIKSGLEAH